MNGGQIISQVLQNHGVNHLFTLCGGHIAPIYVEAAKVGIKVVDVRHEAAAVFGAEAMSRLSGIPGVAAVTAGPGVTNSITALKNAQMAQSPVVLLGGATATLLRNRGALQDIDQKALVAPHVKWVAQVKRVRELAPVLNKAMQIAKEGIPGPVFVEIPVDLLYPEATVREWYGQKNEAGKSLVEKITHWYINRHVNNLFSGVSETIHPPRKVQNLAAAASEVDAVVAALKRAERPVLVVSSGAMLQPQNASELSLVLQKLGIPTYLSGMARGMLGRQFPTQYRHERKKALREADLILLAGVAVDFRLDYGRQLSRKAVKIAVSRSREELHKNLKADQRILADPGQLLTAVGGKATGLPTWEIWRNTLDEREKTREAQIAKQADLPAESINPIALFRRLEELLPQNSTIVADGGDFAATAAYTLRPRHPLGWLDPGAFGTLGVGGGFALGTTQYNPDEYVWIVFGDGSAAYSLMEFDTYTKMGLKVCAIVGNNGSWEQIARDQVTLLGASTATVLPKSNYERVVEAFGAAGERVETLEAFTNAVQHAKASMDRGVPYLINAVIGSTDFRKGSISI
ncbi:MAG: thiamine pyrophosphate-binding protein [Saprospiraceae bacterium]|nr:thiamine pyrophosphate-binding protein [Saprospiraceae bacterium]